MNEFREQLNDMKVGHTLEHKDDIGIWNILRMPTGWVVTMDMPGYQNAMCTFVPDVINVEANVNNHY